MELKDVFEWVSKLGALGVALQALRWSREDKTVAVAAFEKLNEERKKIQDRCNDVIEKGAVENALLKDKVATCIAEIASLRERITALIERAHGGER